MLHLVVLDNLRKKIIITKIDIISYNLLFYMKKYHFLCILFVVLFQFTKLSFKFLVRFLIDKEALAGYNYFYLLVVWFCIHCNQLLCFVFFHDDVFKTDLIVTIRHNFLSQIRFIVMAIFFMPTLSPHRMNCNSSVVFYYRNINDVQLLCYWNWQILLLFTLP